MDRQHRAPALWTVSADCVSFGAASNFLRGSGLSPRSVLPSFLSHSLSLSLFRSLRPTEPKLADVNRRLRRLLPGLEGALVPTCPRRGDARGLVAGRIPTRVVPRLFALGRDGDGGSDDGLDRTEAGALQLVVEGDRHRAAASAVADSEAEHRSIVNVAGDPVHCHRLSFRRRVGGVPQIEKAPTTHREMRSLRPSFFSASPSGGAGAISSRRGLRVLRDSSPGARGAAAIAVLIFLHRRNRAPRDEASVLPRSPSPASGTRPGCYPDFTGSLIETFLACKA